MSSGEGVSRRHVGVRVLIVDDSPLFRRELRSLLDIEGISVVGEAENGLQAVELAEGHSPDVVLMDQNMPSLSGVEATRRIKAHRPLTRVIFVAADARWHNDAIRAGAERYFLKGDDLNELLQTIRDPLAGLRPIAAQAPMRKAGSLWENAWLWRVMGVLFSIALAMCFITDPGVTLLWTALLFGLFFFIYSLKYYMGVALILLATSRNGNGNGRGANNRAHKINGLFNGRRNGNGNGRGLNGVSHINGGSGRLPHHLQPFVSVHLPLYNESEVVDRLLTACTSLDYENYEVIVADDSVDETTQILHKNWGSHPRIKVSHREDRRGFKGGALRVAMGRMDPRTEFIVVFDADFVPPPDILHQFLAYFYGTNGANGNGKHVAPDTTQLDLVDERVAVVQGYQWHMLNASENWITRGIRSEFSGSYVIERSSQELLGSMKMISGSVFMIRADVLKKLGWKYSITEDWELTLRLYLEGYKVLYTPFIQAPAECVANFRQLTRQRMRWAEGHTYNVKKYFFRILRSSKVNIREKLEFFYYAPYYLQSFFFLIGSASWIITEMFLKISLPFWTETLGWALVIANGLSLILMNLTGLFLERGVRKNLTGLLSFILLTYLLVPYQAYAALKGLFESDEGGWHRTQKTGVITEALDRLGLRRRLRRLFPKKRHYAHGLRVRLSLSAERFAQRFPKPLKRLLVGSSQNIHLASSLATGLLLVGILSPGIPQIEAVNRGLGIVMLLLVPLLPFLASVFSRRRRLALRLMSILLASCVTLGILAIQVPTAGAAPNYDVGSSNTFWFYDDTSPLSYMMYQSQPSGSSQTAANTTVSFYSDTWPAGWQVSAGTTTVYSWVRTLFGSRTFSVTLRAGSTSGGWTTLGSRNVSVNTNDVWQFGSTSFSTNAYTFSSGERLRLDITCPLFGRIAWDGSANNSRLVTPTIVVPENAIGLVAVVVLIPVLAGTLRRRKSARLVGSKVKRMGD